MGSILFLTPPVAGHVNCHVGVAQALQGAGHDVSWHASSRTKRIEQLAADGIRVVGDPDPAPPSIPRVGVLAEDNTLERLRERFSVVSRRVEPTRKVIRDVAADVVGLDPMVHEAVIAARLEGVPYVSMCPNLKLAAPPGLPAPYFTAAAALAETRASVFHEFGLEPECVHHECVSPWANTIYSTEAFVGEATRLPPSTFLVGPSLPLRPRGDATPFPWERIDASRPLVFLSLGSMLGVASEPILSVVGAVRRAALEVGAQVVIAASTRGQDASPAATALAESERVIVAPFVPQLDLLARSAVFVTPGGANSVMEALSLGVPMIVLPLCSEQPVQAHFVETSGVGLAFDTAAVTVGSMQEALSLLLERESFRKAAARVRDSYAARDGASTSAEIFSRLCSEPRVR